MNNEELINLLEESLIDKAKENVFIDLVGALTHKWKQPLNLISIIAQDLSFSFQYNELTKESMDECEEKILEQITLLSNSIDEFKSFSKEKNEDKELMLLSFIYEIYDFFVVQFKNHKINIELFCNDDNEMIKITPSNLSQLQNKNLFIGKIKALDLLAVFVNILRNIKLKFTQNEHVLDIILSKGLDTIDISIINYTPFDINLYDNFNQLEKLNENYNFEFDMLITKKILHRYGYDFTITTTDEITKFNIQLKN